MRVTIPMNSTTIKGSRLLLLLLLLPFILLRSDIVVVGVKALCGVGIHTQHSESYQSACL